MSSYTALGFKGYWGSASGPFQETLNSTVTGVAMQQLMNDIGDSCLFQDQSVNTDRNYFENDDFVFSGGIPHGFTSTTSGAGAGISADSFGRDSTEKAIGSIVLDTGTTAAGYAMIYKGIFSMAAGNGQSLRLRMRIALQTLSTGSERYTTYVGFGDNIASGDMTDGCYFRYNDSVNSGRWEAVTSAAGVRTATNTGITAVTTYSIFDIRVNSAGTSVTFYIDDVLVATNTTNIPVSPTYFGLIFKTEKSIGTTSRTNHIDWYDFLISLSSARYKLS